LILTCDLPCNTITLLRIGCDVIRELEKNGHHFSTTLTAGATEFIATELSPLSLVFFYIFLFICCQKMPIMAESILSDSANIFLASEANAALTRLIHKV
jgi:hypothetical protein